MQLQTLFENDVVSISVYPPTFTVKSLNQLPEMTWAVVDVATGAKRMLQLCIDHKSYAERPEGPQDPLLYDRSSLQRVVGLALLDTLKKYGLADVDQQGDGDGFYNSSYNEFGGHNPQFVQAQNLGAKVLNVAMPDGRGYRRESFTVAGGPDELRLDFSLPESTCRLRASLSLDSPPRNPWDRGREEQNVTSGLLNFAGRELKFELTNYAVSGIPLAPDHTLDTDIIAGLTAAFPWMADKVSVDRASFKSSQIPQGLPAEVHVRGGFSKEMLEELYQTARPEIMQAARKAFDEKAIVSIQASLEADPAWVKE